MNLSLKNVKVNDRLSEETVCFTATVCVDGKPVGTAANRGTGGCNEYHWTDREAGRALEEWAARQQTEFNFDKLDQLVDPLRMQAELKQKLSRKTRKSTWFRLKGDRGEDWRTISQPYSPAIGLYLRKKHGDQLEAIANEDLDKAIACALGAQS